MEWIANILRIRKVLRFSLTSNSEESWPLKNMSAKQK